MPNTRASAPRRRCFHAEISPQLPLSSSPHHPRRRRPHDLDICSDCIHLYRLSCHTPCHGWPYDTDSRLRAYEILDTVEIRPTHPVTPIHDATATVVALTPYAALVAFHNRAHGILYGRLGIFLEIENLHLCYLEIPESAHPFVSYP